MPVQHVPHPSEETEDHQAVEVQSIALDLSLGVDNNEEEGEVVEDRVQCKPQTTRCVRITTGVPNNSSSSNVVAVMIEDEEENNMQL